MVETTGHPSVSPPPVPPSPEPAAAPRELSLRALIEAGCHFGHQTRRWDPRMRPFIYGERNGIHIINLDETLARFREALDFLRETVAAGGKVLFVGTKRQAQAPIQFEAVRAAQFYVNNRWLGGTLTNFRTVKKSVERFKEGLAVLEEPEKSAELSKKELAEVSRAVAKYRKSLDGIREMSRLPDAIFLVDVGRERIAVTEALRLDIPIVAIVDTNCNPEGIDHVVPGNDDAIRAIQLYCALAADACLEGAELFNERVQSEVSEQAAAAASAPEGAPVPSTGRVVVEIKQPPRRGRGGTYQAGPRRGGKPEPAKRGEVAEAPATESGAEAPSGS
jgi:small subunit ribosomal protein S2